MNQPKVERTVERTDWYEAPAALGGLFAAMWWWTELAGGLTLMGLDFLSFLPVVMVFYFIATLLDVVKAYFR